MHDTHTVFEVRWDVSSAYRTATARREFENETSAREFVDGHRRKADMSIFKITTERIA